jgi:hypothetical protein
MSACSPPADGIQKCAFSTIKRVRAQKLSFLALPGTERKTSTNDQFEPNFFAVTLMTIENPGKSLADETAQAKRAGRGRDTHGCGAGYGAPIKSPCNKF